jgi:hypothetical protein
MAPIRARNSLSCVDPVRAATASAQTKILEMDPLGLGRQLARGIFWPLGDALSDIPNRDRGGTALPRLGESSRLSFGIMLSFKRLAISAG